MSRLLTEHESLPDYHSWFQAALPPAWSYPRHLRLINDQLARLEVREIDRLMIWMPPRHAKTETVTVRGALRALQVRPDSNILITGYSDWFAKRLSRKVRALAKPLGLVSKDKTSADEWETPFGGVVIAKGVGSPPTGVGFGDIFVDDPIRRREDAESVLFREKLWDWYADDLYTRLEPGGAIRLVMTRWHHDDLAARVLESEPELWHKVVFPALSAEGEPLWPERFNREALERIKRVLTRQDSYSWEGLYQQNPTPKEGSIFKVEQIAYLEEPPAHFGPRARAWDIASSEGRGDFTVGALVGRTAEGQFVLYDIQRGQFATDERRRVIAETARRDGPNVQVIGPEDPGAAGKDAALDFVRLLAGYPVKTKRQTGSKTLRADGLSAQVNQGNFAVVRAAWNSDFVEELRTFPMGKHDDQVDACAEAFNELVGVSDPWNW